LVREGDWLVARLSGPFEIDWVISVVASIGEALRATPTAAVLVDAIEVYGPIADLDRYRFAMGTVEHRLSGPVAFFAKESLVDPQRFGEAVARNRGINVRVFTDELQARAWLKEQTGAPSP
jgi:hypothetical protein